MSYVDGFLLVIPKKNMAAYKKMASAAGKIWKELGALSYFECVGDDLKPKGVRHFPKVAQTKPGETVVFSWVVYKSKAQRDQVNKNLMKHPRLLKMMEEMKSKPPIFDMKKMCYGGFKVLVEL